MAFSTALVVDDSKSARFFLRNLLKKEGISAEMAESGEEALQLLQQQRPELIFMDHMMPGMDGLATVAAIKADSALADIPIIMCTSHEGEEYQQQAEQAGAVGVLLKPAQLEPLQQLLQQCSTQLAVPAAESPLETVELESEPTIDTEALEPLISAAVTRAVSELASRLDQLQQHHESQPQILAVVNQALQPLQQQLQGELEQKLIGWRQQLETAMGEAIESNRAQWQQQLQTAVAGLEQQLAAVPTVDSEALSAQWQQQLAQLQSQLKQGVAALQQQLKAIPVVDSGAISREAITAAKQSAELKALEVASLEAKQAVAEEITQASQTISQQAIAAANSEAEQLIARLEVRIEQRLAPLSAKIGLFAAAAAIIGIGTAVALHFLG
ncbi:response regulator [Ectothiorhodospiraceae bacterium BW-2]|nr:response regulator [Ectothiorhodospiraceae bacterium BW-2]